MQKRRLKHNRKISIFFGNEPQSSVQDVRYHICDRQSSGAILLIQCSDPSERAAHICSDPVKHSHLGRKLGPHT